MQLPLALLTLVMNLANTSPVNSNTATFGKRYNSTTTTAAAKRYDNYKVLEVGASRSAEQRNLLERLYRDADDVDFWSRPSSVRVNHVIVRPDAYDRIVALLDRARLSHRITAHNLQTLIDGERATTRTRTRRAAAMGGPHSIRHAVGRRSHHGGKVVGRYASYSQILHWLRSLPKKYPDLVTVDETQGTTGEGRAMPIVTIHKSGENAPSDIVIDGGIHAREWLSTATAISLIHHLTASHQKSRETQKILSQFRWHFIANLNPDGYEFSRTNDRLWRKNRSTTGGSCIGVDINRNFDFEFGEYFDGGVQPCASDYPGTEPFSERETRVLRDLVQRVKPLVYITLHTFGEFWLIPWSTSNKRFPGYAELTCIARRAAGKIRHAYPKTNWTVGNALATVGYEASGTSFDWAKGVANVPFTYGLELAPNDQLVHAMRWESGFIFPESKIKEAARQAWTGIKQSILLAKSNECASDKSGHNSGEYLLIDRFTTSGSSPHRLRHSKNAAVSFL